MRRIDPCFRTSYSKDIYARGKETYIYPKEIYIYPTEIYIYPKETYTYQWIETRWPVIQDVTLKRDLCTCEKDVYISKRDPDALSRIETR